MDAQDVNHRSLTGTWHLVDHEADEVDIPSHRVDFVLRDDLGELRACLLSRNSGEEIADVHTVSFDGAVLQLQLIAPLGKAQQDMPWLRARAVGDRFEGHWIQDGVPTGPLLKLVRARQ